MKIFGEIRQLEPTAGNAYLNIISSYGMIGVWGSTYLVPTVLVQDRHIFYLLQFSSEGFYQEWLEENKDRYSKIIRLEDVP